MDRCQWILDHCELGKTILDVGSNDGHIFNGTPFAKYVTNVDIDLYDIPNFYRMSAENLKFPDKSFDIGILAEILEHSANSVQILKEANRVAKRVLITVPNEHEWDKAYYPFETIDQGMKRRNLTLEEIAKVSNPNVKEFYTKDNYDHLFHCRYYTQSTLERDLKLAGIKDYKFETLRYGDPQWSFFAIDANCNSTNNKNQGISLILPFRPNDKIVELGGGSNPLVRPNYDIRKLPNVDYVIDLNDPNLPISSDYCDGIYSRYLIEHINWRNIKRFLTETYRILKPNGNIVLITANLLEQAKVLVNTQQWDSDLIGMIFGAEDYKENTHQCGFSPQYITEILTDIGFKNIEITPISSDFGPTDMEIRAMKPYKPDNISKEIKEVKFKGTEQGPIITQEPTITITTGPIPEVNKITDAHYIDIPNITSNSNKLRIALISTPFFKLPPKGYSGLEMVIWDLAEALDELGHEITLFAPEGSQPTKHGKLVTTGPSVSTVNIDWFEEERKRYEIYRQYINSQNFDICHDHTWFAFSYLLKQNDQQLKIIHSHHGGFNWESVQPFGKSNLVSISKYMKQYTEQYFKQKGYNVTSEYIYNGINLGKYQYKFNKAENLLFVGRLSTFKQPHLAIELARKTNHKLDIVGGTFVDSKDYIKQLDKMVENDPNIKIFKDVTHDFKIDKMQNAKALIFPSNMGEPLGLVALEAMSCGTPVIATRDGAIGEVVIHNHTGFICDNMPDMIEAVKNIHTIDPKNCRKRAEELSRQIMAKNYVKLYKRMLNNDEW